MRILLNNLKEDIESIVLDEIESLENVDLEQTVNAIDNYVKKRGFFSVLSWQDSEELAFLVLDWMSMYQAVWKKS